MPSLPSSNCVHENWFNIYRFLYCIYPYYADVIINTVPMSVNLAKCKNLQHFSPRILSPPSLG